MSYTQTFGGATLYPSGQTYLALTFSTSQTLAWPVEQQIGGDNVVADIMDLIATATSLTVGIPDARQVSTGIQSVFVNVGANSFDLLDAAGGTIQSVGSGEAWVIYLTDNTTIAGTWRTFQLGATVGVANAAALAGLGLKAIGPTLNQRAFPIVTPFTPVSITEGERAAAVIFTGGTGVVNLPNPATVGSDWFFLLRNAGSGNLTVTTPSGNIDNASTLVMAPTESAIVLTDGLDFFTVGYGRPQINVFDFVAIDVSGTGDFSLSGENLNRIAYRLTGVLSGNRNIVVPSLIQQYWIDNQTTGNFNLFVKTSSQTPGVQVAQNETFILYCNGPDVIDADSLPQATETLRGGAELATQSETDTGTDDERIVTPLKLSNRPLPQATETFRGAAEVATQAETDVGTDDERIVTPLKLSNRPLPQATETFVGAAEIATQAETNTGTDDTRMVTPLKLATRPLPQATETFRGAAEVATQAEADAGTDDTVMITPAKLQNRPVTQATETVRGGGEIATQAEVNARTDDERIVTALKLFGDAVVDTDYVQLPSWLGGHLFMWGVTGLISDQGQTTVTFPRALGSTTDARIIATCTNLGNAHIAQGNIISTTQATISHHDPQAGVASAVNWFVVGDGS